MANTDERAESLETITCSRAYYTTEGCRCDGCGRRWMEIPPSGSEYVQWVRGCYIAARCERCPTQPPAPRAPSDATPGRG